MVFQVDDLLSSVEKIDIEVRSLDTCAFNVNSFRDILAKVQKAVDELNLHSYSNLPAWVNTLDQQVWKLLIMVYSGTLTAMTMMMMMAMMTYT